MINHDILKHCTLCPRKCQVDRIQGNVGFCGADSNIKVARISLHQWEEPCISGRCGSGTVFFSHCTLKCVYCQNYDISTNNHGKIITTYDLSNAFFRLKDMGAHNINLVTPTHYLPMIQQAIDKAKTENLNLPIIYNTSGYENVSSIKSLDNYIDVYLPDMKYFYDDLSIKYSNAKNYFSICDKSIEEMVKQTGPCRFDNDGIIQKGVIVRHLVLPGQSDNSKKVLHHLYKKYKDDIFISIMSQYTPLKSLPENFGELNRKVYPKEYDDIIEYAIDLGIKNAYVQEGESACESFIPNFDEKAPDNFI